MKKIQLLIYFVIVFCLGASNILRCLTSEVTIPDIPGLLMGNIMMIALFVYGAKMPSYSDELVNILLGEIPADCDTCRVKENCPHNDTCKERRLDFYRKVAEQD